MTRGTAAVLAIDSHIHSSTIRLHIRQAKSDPSGNGMFIFLERTGCQLCPARLYDRTGTRGGPLVDMRRPVPITPRQVCPGSKSHPRCGRACTLLSVAKERVESCICSTNLIAVSPPSHHYSLCYSFVLCTSTLACTL